MIENRILNIVHLVSDFECNFKLATFLKFKSACVTVSLPARHTAPDLWPGHTLELLSNQSTGTDWTKRYRPISNVALFITEKQWRKSDTYLIDFRFGTLWSALPSTAAPWSPKTSWDKLEDQRQKEMLKHMGRKR